VTTIAIMVPVGIWFWETWQASQPPETIVGSLPVTTLPSIPAEDTATTTVSAPAEPPECTVGDEPVQGDPAVDWATIVVDTGRRLPPNFQPPDLVDIAEAGFESNDEVVRQVIIDDLRALREGAEANGTPIIIASGYRTNERQQLLYDAGVEEHEPEGVVTRIARPGHSEHQLGTAIDVVNPEATSLDVGFASTPAGQWVSAHAHEFGFVLSYPEGGVEQACYEYEPWHVRYVGRERAAQIRDSGLTPREWMLTEAATREGGAGHQATDDSAGAGTEGEHGTEHGAEQQEGQAEADHQPTG
jgi:D-alanyl-D-alanine carboxypeptidase